VLGDGVVVVDLLYHLDVELLLAFRKFGLEDHEEVVTVLVLEGYALCEGRHLARGQVDPAFQLARTVAEEEHVGVVLSPEVFEASHDGNGVEALPVEDGVLDQLLVDLGEGEGDDGLVVDGLVFLFGRVCHLPPDIIILDKLMMPHFYPFSNSISSPAI
jgi:hypothetical protein